MTAPDPKESCDLSVIIPCRNAGRLLAEQLEALSRQEWEGSWEVLVADNGSTDDSVDVARSYDGRLATLRVLDASDRPGQAHARNVCVREARGRLILFADADDVVGDGYIATMAHALETSDFVCGRLEFERLNPRWVLDLYAGTFPDGIPNSFGFLPHAPAGTTGIHKSLLDRLGGFDEKTPPFEDLDLSWRAQLSGVPLVFVADAIYHYRLRGSLRSMMRQARAFGRAAVAMRRRYRHYLPRGPAPTARARSWAEQTRQLTRVRTKAQLYRLAVELATRFGKLEERVRLRLTGTDRYPTLPPAREAESVARDPGS